MPKILVADDNAAMARLVSATLPETYEVVHARDGDEALRKARRFIPDLIILDVNMPGLNGFEVLQKIRSSEGLKHAKVIMVTARDLRNLTQDARLFLGQVGVRLDVRGDIPRAHVHGDGTPYREPSSTPLASHEPLEPCQGLLDAPLRQLTLLPL